MRLQRRSTMLARRSAPDASSGPVSAAGGGDLFQHGLGGDGELVDEVNCPRLFAIIGSDAQSLGEIIQYFTEDTQSRMAEIAVAIHERRRAAVAQYAHALRGSVANFSVGATYTACARLEELALNGSWEQLTKVHMQLRIAQRGLADSLTALRLQCIKDSTARAT